MSMIIYSLIRFRKTCQNLSVAGRMEKLKTIDEINDDNLYDIENRSNMLWQVDRILSECENKPQILLMENVTQVHGAGNEEHFKQWLLRLEEMGYQSYWQDLSATEFKIPQTRNRTFMVSILGNYNYTFPKKTKLELRLKDLLEPEGTVDEKFYISDKMINYISKTGANGFNNKDAKINLDIARPLTTDPNKRAETTNYLSSDFPGNFDLSKVHGTKNRAELLLLLLSKNGELEKHNLPNGCDSSLNNPKIREVSNTITTRYDAGIQNQQQIGMCVVENGKTKIKNATKKGYLEAHEGDGIDISSRMETHRGTVQKGKSQTITTMGGENVGVVIKENLGYTEKSLNKIKKNIVDKNDVSGSLTATGMQSLNHDGCQLVSSPSVTTAFNPNYKTGLRIRKLTPKECFRLQAVKDEDIDLIMKNQSNSLGYHLAGDSICITVLMAIFSKLFEINWLEHFNPEEWWKN